MVTASRAGGSGTASAARAAASSGSSGGGALARRLPAEGPSLHFDSVEGLLELAGDVVPASALAEAQPEVEAEVRKATAEARRAELQRLLRALPPKEHDQLWQRVLRVARASLDPRPFLPAAAEEDRQARDEALPVVHAVAVLCEAFAEHVLDAGRDPRLPPRFHEVVSLAQEVLLHLPDVRTQALIARTLEKICTGAFERREDFFGGFLMYLIGRCLEPKMTGVDVARLHKVRDLLYELDWNHESIESLKMQLLRCAANPGFVRTHQGQELLALFYVIHPGFTAEVHQTVKNQLLYCRPAVLKAYAVGLFKAWKMGEAGAKLQVERCVQDWALLAIRSARRSAEKACGVLEEFHLHHHDQPVNELLCRVYGPVLWRSLKVANAVVRENATRLLQYIFPLMPNDVGLAEQEQELQQELCYMRATLEDPSEAVRRAGIGAVSNILKNYWDMLPCSEIAEILTVLMQKCALDKKAPSVRAAVAEGFACVLTNPLSHPTMAAVLPQTSFLLDDRSPLVRASFINLLSVVMQCRGVSIQQVVTNEHLMTRLLFEHTEGQAERLERRALGKNAPDPDSAEGRASCDIVAKKLARLMSPSLFQHDIATQVSRCHYLMTHWPLALLALLTDARDTVPAPDRMKLAAALFHYCLKDLQAVAGTGRSSKGRKSEPKPKPKRVGTMLLVVGVLLEGAFRPSRQRGKRGRGGAAGSKSDTLTPELESFVYEHIKEADFLPLLRAIDAAGGSGSEGPGASSLVEDLLFAMSHLDPTRLPRTVELVRHELMLACRGGTTVASDAARGLSGTAASPRLLALLRTAVRWELAGEALEPAWERLEAAATRLSLRQPVGDDASSAVAVVEAVFQDSEVRAAVLPTKADTLTRLVEAIVAAFGKAWAGGCLGKALKAAESEPTALGGGPAGAELWPRLIGLVVRMALHLEHRVVAPQAQAAATSTDDAQEAPKHPRGPAEGALKQLATTLSSKAVLDALRRLEASASADKHQPPRKRARSSSGGAASAASERLPGDIDAVLRVHERVLEAMNVAHFLSVLRITADEVKRGVKSPAACGGADALGRAATDLLWRWASVADSLQPEDDLRSSKAWILMGRLLHQVAAADAPTPDVLTVASQLFSRTTDEVPGDDADIKKVLQGLFSQLEYDPQLHGFVAKLVGIKLDGSEAMPAAEGGANASEAHPRVAAVAKSLLPAFRGLRTKLLPDFEEAAQLPPPGADPDGANDAEVAHTQLDGPDSTAVDSEVPSTQLDAPGSTMDSEATDTQGGAKRLRRRLQSRSVASQSNPPSTAKSTRTSEGSMFRECFADVGGA